MLGHSIRQTYTALQTGAFLPSEVLQSSLERLEKLQPLLNAATVILKDRVKFGAAQSDKRYKNGCPVSMLDGLPIAVKDNFCLSGELTTCGSRMLRNFVPKYNATVVEKTCSAGGVVVAKTNMDEFGMGSGCVDSCFGAVKSIWRSGIKYKLVDKTNSRNNLESQYSIGSSLNADNFEAETDLDENMGSVIAGGSSGGSATLVASGVVFAALGSDTGGSVRIPGSWSGLATLKPTYGHISRHGLIPLVNSLDVPGILARNVEDVVIYYDLLKGRDNKDSTTINAKSYDTETTKLMTEYSKSKNLNGIKVGIPKEYACEGMSSEVVQSWSEVADMLENEKVRVEMTSLPHTCYSISCYQVLNPCEVASNMARYDGLEYGLRTEKEDSTESLFANVRHNGFNEVVRGRILAGNYFLLRQNYEKYFLKALKVRRLIADDFQKVFNDVDVLLTPSTLCDAPFLGDFLSSDNRTQTSKHDYCTQPVNLAGLPAATVPVKLSNRSLPLSVQIIGRHGREDQVLSVAKWIEDRVHFPKVFLCD